MNKAATEPLVAGRPFTYVITVANSGDAATGLLITDVIPVGGTYVSGGTRIGDYVALTVPQVSTNGQASAQWTVRTCQISLTNRWYRVVTSTKVSPARGGRL